MKKAGLTLLSGRDIDIHKYPGDSNAVLLNEAAVKLMGFAEPVGQVINYPGEGRSLQVVGVVKDFVAGSAYETFHRRLFLDLLRGLVERLL